MVVRERNAAAIAIAWRIKIELRPTGRSKLNKRAKESSPIQPKPRLATVMPICVTARYSLTWSTTSSGCLAASFPSSSSSSRRVRRTRTDGKLGGYEHPVCEHQGESSED